MNVVVISLQSCNSSSKGIDAKSLETRLCPRVSPPQHRRNDYGKRITMGPIHQSEQAEKNPFSISISVCNDSKNKCSDLYLINAIFVSLTLEQLSAHTPASGIIKRKLWGHFRHSEIHIYIKNVAVQLDYTHYIHWVLTGQVGKIPFSCVFFKVAVVVGACHLLLFQLVLFLHKCLCVKNDHSQRWDGSSKEPCSQSLPLGLHIQPCTYFVFIYLYTPFYSFL